MCAAMAGSLSRRRRGGTRATRRPGQGDSHGVKAGGVMGW